MAKIYLASSWRNQYYNTTLRALRDNGHEVFDFRDHKDAFRWDDIDPNWKDWSIDTYRGILKKPAVFRGYNKDFNGMAWADACVLLLPCGRSAHLEAGWFIGKSKPTIIYLKQQGFEPELMYRLANKIVTTEAELLGALSTLP